MTKKTAELERLLEIAEGYAPSQMTTLLHRLETEEGGKVTARGVNTWFTLAGLKARAIGGDTIALQNWLNKARRVVRRAV